MNLDPEAAHVTALFRVAPRRTDRTGLGPVIVSMTRSVADLLVVYLLAREGGLLIEKDGGLACELAVAPLFETIRDLENSAGDPRPVSEPSRLDAPPCERRRRDARL